MNLEWLDSVPTFWGTLAHTLVWIGIVAWAWRRETDRDEGHADLRWWIVALGVVQIGIYLAF